MKTIIIIIALLSCLFLTGCGESFTAGAAAGAALADNVQKDFIGAVTRLNQVTAEVNGAIDGIDGSILLKPEAIEAYESLKATNWKDPTNLIAAVTIFGSAFFGGKVHSARKL